MNMRCIPVFASLGRDCQVNYQLRRSGYPVYPTPFDRMLVPARALFGVLSNEERLESSESWSVKDRNLVHSKLPMKVGHVRFKGLLGEKYEWLRLSMTMAMLRGLRHMPVTPVFVRLADGTNEFARSEELLALLRQFTPNARLVHLSHSDEGSSWFEKADGLVVAQIARGSSWRGDSPSWRVLCARMAAWVHRDERPSGTFVKPTMAMLASALWPRDWSKLEIHFSKEDRRNAPDKIDPLLVTTLVLSEDRRFYWHAGIDAFRTLRVSSEWLLGRTAGGGSTIEQQLVRVLTGHYEKTIARKTREMFLAVSIGSRLSKREIAEAYLLNGYFGRGMQGLHQAVSRIGFDPRACNREDAAYLMSCLKYPWSPQEKPRWTKRREVRKQWILSRLDKVPWERRHSVRCGN